MASTIRMMAPLPYFVANTSTYPGASRVTSGNPKEAAVATSAGNYVIDLDLGSVQTFDTVFIGYTNFAMNLSINYGSSSPASTAFGTGMVGPALADIPIPQHYLSVQATPVSGRYLRIGSSTQFAAGASIGVVAVGKSFAPTWNQEISSGRPIEDTSNVERLFGGGFGIDLGAIVGGYQWTFGDLSDVEIRALYAFVRSVGSSRSMLMCEDITYSAGLNERIHWGLLDKLDAYERNAPNNSKWALKIRDWG